MKATHTWKPSDHLPNNYGAEATNINLPNLLTLSRLLLIPVFVVVFLSPTPERSLVAAAVFLVAALTDFLDGYLARRSGQVTQLGRLLDPVADKLLVLSGLILLVQAERVAAWVAIVIIARELAVTGIRALAAKDGVTLSVEVAGKLKMIAQVVAILLLLLQDALSIPGVDLHVLGTAVLYLAMVLTLASGGQYIMRYWQIVSGRPSVPR